MGQAALKIEPDYSPANDEWQGPPTDGDPWPWLIERFKSIKSSLGIFAAQRRLSGQSCREFCEEFLAAMEYVEAQDAAKAQVPPGGIA